MPLTLRPIPPPLREDESGAIRVGRTRVTLDSGVAAQALAAAPFDDEPLDSEALADLEASERDRQEGRVLSHEEARRQLLGPS